MLAVVSCHVSANPGELASRTSHLLPSGSSLQLGKPQGLSCHHGASPGGAPLPPPPWHHPPLLPPLPLPRPPLPSPTPPTPPDPCTHLQAGLCGHSRDGTEHQPAQVRNSLNFLIKNQLLSQTQCQAPPAVQVQHPGAGGSPEEGPGGGGRRGEAHQGQGDQHQVGLRYCTRK